MKTVKLILLHNKVSKDTSFLGKMISIWTRSIYYHTEIVVDGYRVISRPGHGLVIDKSMPKDVENWDIVTFPNLSVTDAEYDKIFKWLWAQEGKKYDIKGIFLSQILKLNTHSHDRWFCSEIATTILQLFNVPKSEDLIPNNVSPAILGRIYSVEDMS